MDLHLRFNFLLVHLFILTFRVKLSSAFFEGRPIYIATLILFTMNDLTQMLSEMIICNLGFNGLLCNDLGMYTQVYNPMDTDLYATIRLTRSLVE